ncbi:hypothetical protein BKH41_03760 [Helicobacter sp. 12S02232-10]|uniref:phage tail assembly protein n=1 Tax=Helicobacter sp. 12S02232-10 TaxID=1476197 RepID=UPI000BA6A09B|nr:phage tail assembly protein [Helicobacter sp. 12S02232-10]PAF49207.1 hypothetical protein BKH41_03760 [Helicobacter sp. 12S02232-10]
MTETDIKTFTLKNGKEITLKEPTILQLESAQKKSKDELTIAKHLLVDMSEGDLTIDSINQMGVREFKRLLECVKEFMGFDPKD